MQLFLVSLGLCFAMWATLSIWILIPTGITFGTGILLTYCSFTGNWRHWVFLWLFELLSVIGSIWAPIRLSRHKDLARRLSRSIAGLIGILSFALIPIIALAAIVRSLFG
jgi:hypothetical protein